jgi:hypothetical protein
MNAPARPRRGQFLTRTAGMAALALPPLPALHAAPAAGSGLALARVGTDALDVAYHEAGRADGRPVVLVHDFGYDIHNFERVVPILVATSSAPNTTFNTAS